MTNVAVLLVEDDTEIRELYATCLRAEGFDVCEAADGREALELIAMRRPTLMLLDVWMPVLNGFEVLEQIQLDPMNTGLKVVMLSNLSDSDTRLECFSAGAVDYWIKGLPLTELCARVKELLADAEVLPHAN